MSETPKRKPNPNRSKNPRDENLQTAVTEDTKRRMRVQAAQHDVSLSMYVYEILKLATRNFTVLNLTDIEQNCRKENEK